MKKILHQLFVALFCVFAIPAYACTSNEFDVNGTCVENKFEITTTNLSANTTFKFKMSAAGVFYIDWGDGTVETKDRTNNTTLEQYTHIYTTAGTYTIKFSGTVTGYNSAESVPSIRFGHIYETDPVYNVTDTTNTPELIASVSGNLGTLFPVVSGMGPNFVYAFRGCTSLTSLPVVLFADVSMLRPYLFAATFQDCTGLTTVPSGLFSGSSGQAVHAIFGSTFKGCTGLTSLPGNLFGNISVSSGQYLFSETFSGCTNLTSISSDLFNGISGIGVYMFYEGFKNCTSLTSLPSGLFSRISGSAQGAFYRIFSGCTNLTSVPYNLFSGLYGTAGNDMFYQAFYNNTSLSRFVYPDGSYVNYIPPYFFGNISGGTGVMTNVFYGNTAIAASCPTGTSQNVTGYESYWDGHVACKVDWPFSLTTTNLSAGSIFKFQMSAAGVFTVDWGDGTAVQTIDRTNDTTLTQYTHTFATAGTYTIKFGGRATGYNSENFMSAIKFGTITDEGNTHYYIASISGSLGAIFPTLNNGSNNKALQPQFYGTFAWAPITSIPANLFDGVFGVSYKMFDHTFSNCSGLTSIPENLFGNIRGIEMDLFYYTFAGTGITSIPENLFSGITGTTGWTFEGTFRSCASLTSIPAGLFKGIKGGGYVPSLFSGTFRNCTSLTSVPSGLLDGITGTSAAATFASMFQGCTSLTSVPYNLLGNLSGTPGEKAFITMFSGDTALSRFVYPDGSYVSYVPPEFFGNLSSTGYVAGNSSTSAMYGVFYNTAIATSCPNGTVQNITGFEDDWSSKVSCEPSTITINWGNGNGGIHETNTCTYGGDITTPTTAPTKRGYRFIGWVFD